MNWRVVAIAAVSAIVLVVLVARYDALAQGPRWSPAIAENHARETARRFGLAPPTFRVTATGVVKENLLRFVQRSHPKWLAPFAPIRYVVEAESSAYGTSFRAEYTPEGQLLRFDCSRCADRSGEVESPEQILSLLAEGHASEFSLRDRGGADGTSRWSWNPSTAGASLEARITLEKGRATSAVLDPDVSTQDRARHSMLDFASAMRGISLGLSGSAVVLAGVIAFFRGRSKRPVWRIGAAIYCFWIAVFLIGCALNGYRWPEQQHFVASETGTQPDGNLVVYLINQPLLWWLACAAGVLLIRGEIILRWVGFLQAFERWRPARRTGQELMDGLLLGWPLALAPYIAGVFGGPVWDVVSPRVGFELTPAVAGLLRRTSVSGEIVLYFGFLVPLGTRFIRHQPWRRAALAVAALALFGWAGSNLPAKPALDTVAGILLAIVAMWIYRGHGLLGTFAATWGAAMAAPLAWLLSSPLAHPVALLFSSACYGGALAGAAWVRRHDFVGEDEDLAAEVARRNEPGANALVRSERELLRAEFAEAREAQMGMLPDKPPEIEGFSVAAVCQPAREVGGDLYDFVEFPDGNWGFCVADVSGKGVPAALYMTMTKGLLASEGRVAGDLNELVLALNEPLYLAGRKKTFVTLVMARLDPRTRCLQMIRAGHNPVLWRRARLNETIYLQPAGLGLGLVSNKMLRRKLEMSTIELEPGDTVVLYSDGLTEAENPRLELFGEDRLLRIVERSDAMTAVELMKEVLDEVEVFKQGADPHDDLTLMVLKVETR